MDFDQTRNLIGRILIPTIFIYAITGKILNFERTVEVISIKNIPLTLAPYLLLLAIIFLVFSLILLSRDSIKNWVHIFY